MSFKQFEKNSSLQWNTGLKLNAERKETPCIKMHNFFDLLQWKMLDKMQSWGLFCWEECEKIVKRTEHQEPIWILMCRHLKPILMSNSWETVLGLYGFGIPGIIRYMDKICHLRVQGGCVKDERTQLWKHTLPMTSACPQSDRFFLRISLAIEALLYRKPKQYFCST